MTSFNLWEHNGTTVINFQAVYNSSTICLFNSTNYLPNDININIDLNKIKEYNKPHYEIEKINNNNIIINNNHISKSKNIFINDSFYNSILQSEEKQNNFKNIHKDTNFKKLESIDKSNSSVYFYCQKITELKQNGTIERIENTINTQLNSLYKYKKENLSIITDLYMYHAKNNDFKYYRKVKADGNSFYISFMYQYFRKLINDNNQTKISNIFNIDKDLTIINKQIIKKKNTINNNNDIGAIKRQPTIGRVYLDEDYNDKDLDNIVQAFGILSLIYLKTVDKKFDEALRILDYSFSYEKTFVYILCLFMRVQIKKFITINKDIFTYDKYCKKYKLISEEYYDINNKIFLYENYINENVLVDQLEPSLFIISLVPYIFNINLNLYINEISSFKELNDSLFNKITLNQNNKIIINILYTSFSYHIIEMEPNKIPEYITPDLSNIFNLTNIDNSEEKGNYIQEIHKNNYNEKCEICSGTTFIKLKKISKNEICLNCFKKTINELFKQRYNYMKKEQFKYIEYYLREIPLTYSNNINNYIYLTSSEFYFIFQYNIFSYFRKLIENMCDICCNIYFNKIINKNCKCKRCIKCAKKEINDNIVLNDFEIKFIYKNKLIKCECGKEIKQLDYMSQIVNILSGQKKEEYENEAKKRISNYIKNYCMCCGTKINVYDKENENYSKFNFENNNYEHLICKKCYKDINSNNKNYFCIICQEMHINIKEKKKVNNNKINNKNKIEENKSKDPRNKNNISKSERLPDIRKVNLFDEINNQPDGSKDKMTDFDENNNKKKRINERKIENNNEEINKKEKICCIKIIWNKILNIFSKSNS